jgi:Skp family chaperone for outer membrane proteins
MVLAGCAKKADRGPAPTKTSTSTSPAAPQASPPASPTSPGAAVNVAADLQKSIAAIESQAQTMNVADLKATAVQYQQALSAKQADLQKLAAEVKGLSITDALGDKGKALKADAQKNEADVKTLKDRFQVYYNKLKEKGGDVSGLTN